MKFYSRSILTIFHLVFVFLIFSSSAEERLFEHKGHMKGKFTIDRPPSNSKLGALVFFHGSGASDSYASGFAELSKLARKFKLTAISIQAPNGVITWAEKGPPSGRIQYAQSLLETVAFGKEYDLDPNKTVFVGVSAGSTFIAGDFLPAYIDKYKGGAVLLCGGASPIYPTNLPTSISGFKMFSAIQQTDFLFGQSMAGIDFWRSHGVLVKSIQPKGSGHCGFDIYENMKAGIKFILD